VSLLACSWLSPPRPGFRRRFTLCAHTPPRASQMARPMTSRSGPSAARRLLQPTQPASTTAGPPEPRLRCNEHSQRALARAARSTPRRCFRAAVGPGSRARPKPRSSTAAPAPSTGGAASPAHRGPFGLPRAVAGRGRSRIRRVVEHPSRFHGPGAGRLSSPAPCSRRPFRAAMRERYPNPIRSDTSRRETAAPSAGDSDVAQRRSRPGGAPMTISPHEPHPREG